MQGEKRANRGSSNAIGRNVSARRPKMAALPKKRVGTRASVPRAAKGRAARELVDAIFAQWQAERPDIDASPVHVFGLIGRIQIQCTAFIDEVLEPFGLTRGSFDVLTALRRAGAPYCLSPKQIAQSLLLSGAGLTSRLNKLRRDDLDARFPGLLETILNSA